ncbi:MAG: hypothetical protein HFI37_06705 [Lachnospiraceae bacterium]|nr:hypothetical protein [Lachnospiraceae bacterium]
MKKRKHLYLHLLTLCFLAAFFFVVPVKAQASSCRQCNRETKIGKYYIWNDYNSHSLRISTSKSGNGKVLAKPSAGRSIAAFCISDGSTVYYAENGAYNSAGNCTSYIYKIRVNGKGRTKIGKLKNSSGPKAYYKGNLYLSCFDQSDGTLIHTYSMSVKTGKAKRIMKNAAIQQQNGQYLLASPNSGAVIPLDLYIYNCKTKKQVRITKKSVSANIVGKKLYYAECVKDHGTNSTFRIRSCNLSGKSKKTIKGTLNASGIGKITSKYVCYYIYKNYGGYRYYRYDFKSKKAKEISYSSYSR